MLQQNTNDPKVEFLIGYIRIMMEYGHRVNFLFERHQTRRFTDVHLYKRSYPVGFGPKGMYERVYSTSYETNNIDREKTAPLKGALELVITEYLEGKLEREYKDPPIDMQTLASGRPIERYYNTVRVDYAAAKVSFDPNNLKITPGRKIEGTMNLKKPDYKIKSKT